MPYGVYSNNICKEERKNIFEPTPHQIETLNYFLNSEYRGLLLYHRLGSGKTCTSYMISDKLLELKKINHVYVFSPGSLRNTWVSEYCNVCGDKDNNYFQNNYTFITYNYASRNIPDLNDSLIIIDECHNLINGVKNDSPIYNKLYTKIERSNCRILALSGTPIIKNIYDFSFLGRLLKGSSFFNKIYTKNYEEVERFTQECINGKMREKLKGIISYYPGKEDSEIPKIIYKPPIKIKMVPRQEKHWERLDYIEDLMSLPVKESLKFKNLAEYLFKQRMRVMALKKIITRKISNIYIPIGDMYKSKYKIGSINDIKDSSFFRDNGGLINFSPKYVAIFANIVKHINQKQALFTFYKDFGGVNFIKRMLDSCGVKSEIFSGDLTDSKREKLLKKFNSAENRNGELINILLITEAGAEGISLLETRHFHIVESSTSAMKIVQAIGRLARYKSHSKLPKEDRNVTVWRYWSIFRDGGMCVDEKLYLLGEEKLKEYNLFLDILKDVSVTSF
jgi:hypothetical protein